MLFVVVVVVATADVATMDVDYSSVTIYITFIPPVIVICIPVNITGDDVLEETEVFGIHVEIGSERGVLLTPDGGIVIIEGLYRFPSH